MTLTVFASGSTGNCALLSDGETHILIDAGISRKRIVDSLALCAVSPQELTGVLITHEHTDHVSGLPMLCKLYATPVYAPRTVANHLRRAVAGVDDYLHDIPVSEPFMLGEVRVTAFPTPHDSDQSVGYRFEGSDSFGFCTDCGHVSGEMREGLRGCRVALVEANHDEEMLRYGSYPAYLKRRILSDTGHLSNDACAALCTELAESGTETFVLAHLSRENNRPALARKAVETALCENGRSAKVEIAPIAGALKVGERLCCG